MLPMTVSAAQLDLWGQQQDGGFLHFSSRGAQGARFGHPYHGRLGHKQKPRWPTAVNEKVYFRGRCCLACTAQRDAYLLTRLGCDERIAARCFRRERLEKDQFRFGIGMLGAEAHRITNGYRVHRVVQAQGADKAGLEMQRENDGCRLGNSDISSSRTKLRIGLRHEIVHTEKQDQSAKTFHGSLLLVAPPTAMSLSMAAT